MKTWKRRLLFLTAMGFAILGVILIVGIAYLVAPVCVPDLDPKIVMKDKAPPAPSDSRKPLSNKENIDLLASAAKFENRDVQLPRDPDKEHLEALLRIKEEEGRDNAMIHYLAGLWKRPPWPDMNKRPLDPLLLAIDRVFERGWRRPDCDLVLPYLESWKPALDEVRRGTALDYARSIGRGDGWVFYRLVAFAEYAARILCIRGRYLESRDRYGEALEDYMSALTLGRDFSVPIVTLWSYGSATRIDILALTQIYRLAAVGNLAETDVPRVLERLREIRDSRGNALDVLPGEMADVMDTIQRGMRRPLEFYSIVGREYVSLERLAKSFLDPSIFDTMPKYMEQLAFRMEVRQNTERIQPDLAAVFALQEKALNEPWYGDSDRAFADLDRRVRSSHAAVRFCESEYSVGLLSLRIADLKAITAIEQTRLAAALAEWRRRNGEFPADLSQLEKDFFPHGLPVDPFSGASFRYRRTPRGDDFALWSVGPDRKDDGLALYYDSQRYPGPPWPDCLRNEGDLTVYSAYAVFADQYYEHRLEAIAFLEEKAE